jgi:ketosteroid isomerase-like protein
MTTTTTTVLALGERWAAAERAGDAEALSALADDGFRLVGPFGFVLDKQQWLDRYRTGAFHTHALHWDEVSVANHGDVAITIGKQTQQATYQGQPADGTFRVSHVFARQPDGWRLLGMHLSQAAPPQRP